MNTSADAQILAAYNQGMTPDCIAEDLGFAVHAVKARLMALSTDYRKACNQEAPDEDVYNYSPDQKLRIKDELYQLAMSTEDEHLKGKLLLNLRDDSMGRKNLVKVSQNSQFNIMQVINNSISQAREGARQVTDKLKLVES